MHYGSQAVFFFLAQSRLTSMYSMAPGCFFVYRYSVLVQMWHMVHRYFFAINFALRIASSIHYLIYAIRLFPFARNCTGQMDNHMTLNHKSSPPPFQRPGIYPLAILTNSCGWDAHTIWDAIIKNKTRNLVCGLFQFLLSLCRHINIYAVLLWNNKGLTYSHILVDRLRYSKHKSCMQNIER